MNRILFHSSEVAADGTVRLRDARARHLMDVLHAGIGQRVRAGLLDGPKGTARVLEADSLCVTLRFDPEGGVPLRPAIDLLLALPRPKVMKRLWAQLAALGVGRIVLTNAEKVERFYFDSHVLDPSFYTPLLIEGLQQAGDTRMPVVHVARRLKPWIEDELDGRVPDAGLRLLADPSGPPGALPGLLNGLPTGGRVLVAVGPEGGWTPYELDLFRQHSFRMVGMGPRILRTDTACVALLSQVALYSGANETQMD